SLALMVAQHGLHRQRIMDSWWITRTATERQWSGKMDRCLLFTLRLAAIPLKMLGEMRSVQFASVFDLIIQELIYCRHQTENDSVINLHRMIQLIESIGVPNGAAS